MPMGLKIKDKIKTVYFDSHWTSGVNHRSENEVSSEENGEENEEDSDYDPE